MKTYSRKKPGNNQKVILDLNELCRLCMGKDGGLVPIFNDDDPVSISVQIMACVALKVSEGDDLPDKICHPCRHQLEISYAFRKQCEVSDFKLQLLKNLRKNAEKKSIITDEIEKYSDSAETPIEVKTEDCSVEIAQISYIKPEPDDDLVPLGLSIEGAEESEACTFNRVWLKSEEVKLEQEDEVNVFLREDRREMEEDQIENQDLETSKPTLVSHPNPDLTDELQRKVDRQAEKPTQFQVTTENGSVVVMELITEDNHVIVPSLPEPQPKFNEERKLKVLRCPDCTKTFVRRVQLRRHVSVVHGNSCRFCKKSFLTRTRLMIHERIHTGERPFRCEFCEKSFCQKANLSRHRATHAEIFECPDCPEKFNKRVQLRRHASVHTNRPYRCGICNKRFTTRTTMVRHERIHTGERPFRCKFCAKSFCQRENLLNHYPTHAGEKPFKCPHCLREFPQQRRFRIHLQTHHNSRPCMLCPKVYLYASGLT